MSDPIPVLQFPSPNGLSDSAASIGRSLNEAVETPPLCRDCRWAVPHIIASQWECRAPQNLETTISLVTGEPLREWRYSYCAAQRAAGPHGDGDVAEANCSKSGRWFSPRDAQ